MAKTIAKIKDKAVSGAVAKASLMNNVIDTVNALIDRFSTFSVTMTGGGAYEIGDIYSPSGSFSAKYDDEDVTSSSTITISSGTISGTSWSDSNTSSDKTWTITAVYEGNTDTASCSVSFLPYLYQGETNSSLIGASVIKGLSKSLSADTTKSATGLAADKYYIFACKGNVSLVCRENSTNGIVSATTGTINIERENKTATDLYSYIIVPASSMAWTFKITNS